MKIAISLSLCTIVCAEIAFCQSTTTDSLYLQEKPELLNTVVVFDTDNKNATSQRNKPVASDNMDKILEQHNQLKMIKRGGYAFDPVIQGMVSGQRSVTIDGMRIFGACTDRMDPVTSYVSANNLSSAEISTSASSSKFGSSLHANLNMVTAKAQFSDSLKVTGKLDLGAGSASQEYRGGLNLNVGAKKWALMLSGTQQTAQSYRAGGGEIIDFTQFQKENLAANLRVRLGKKTIAEGKYIFDNATNIGYAALPMDVSLARSHIAQISTKTYNLTTWLKTLETSIYANRIEHIMDDTKRPPETIAMHMDMPGWSKTNGAFIAADIHLSPKDRLELRFDAYQNYQFAEMVMYPNDPTEAPMYMVTWPGVERSAGGVYLLHNRTFSKSLELNTSFRVETARTEVLDSFGLKQLEVFQFDSLTQLNHRPIAAYTELKKAWNKKFIASFGAGYSERLPTTSELYGFYLFNILDGYDYIGDPNLEMEKAWKVSGSFMYHGKKTHVHVSSSYSYISNYIYGVIEPSFWAMTIGANGGKMHTNMPWAQLANLNAVCNYQFNKHWRITNQGSYTWGERNNKMPIPQLSPFSYASRVSYTKNNWSTYAEAQGATAQDLIDTEFIENRTASWAIVNLGLSKQLEFKNKQTLRFDLNINNLFDHNYHQHLDWGDIARPGINVAGGVSWRF